MLIRFSPALEKTSGLNSWTIGRLGIHSLLTTLPTGPWKEHLRRDEI